MKRFELAATTIMALCALVVVGLLARREFRGGASAVARQPVMAQVSLDSSLWADLLRVGRPLDDNAGTDTVVVLSDLECPSCRAFHAVTRRLLDEHPTRFTFLFVHYPLSYHRFAMPAARFAECAAERGGFALAVDAVFASQDSLGLLPWSSLAARAGIADARRVESCAIEPDSERFSVVARGMSLGKQVGVKGTPTVVMNRRVFATVPDEQALLESLTPR